MKKLFRKTTWMLIAFMSIMSSCDKQEPIEQSPQKPQDGDIAVGTEIIVDGENVTNTRAASEAGYTTGDGLYDKGVDVTVAAFANDGYELTAFYDKQYPDVNLGSSHTFPVTIPQTFKAEFARKFTISVSASPSDGGTVTGGGKYKNGASCTLTATSNSGYTFDGWYEGSTKVSSNSSYSFTVSSNRTMTARFEVISTVVNVNLKWRLNASSGNNYSSSYEYVILNSDLGNRVNLLFYGTTSNTMTGDDDIAYPLTVVSDKEECYKYYYSEAVDYDGNYIGRDGTPSSFDLLIDNKVVLSKLQPELSFLNGKSYTIANYTIVFSVSRK